MNKEYTLETKLTLQTVSFTSEASAHELFLPNHFIILGHSRTLAT